MTDDAKPGKGGRWIKIALVLSLCLNVLVIGAVGGFFWKHRDGWEPGRFALHRVLRALPEDRRDAARAAIEARLPEYESLRDQLREARRESAALLVADPLDEAALRASVLRARKLNETRRMMIEDALIGFAAGLSLEERKAIADQLTRGRDRRWRERKRD